MNKQEKNKSRIEIIKEERRVLLEEVKTSIEEGNQEVITHAGEIISLIKTDDISIKKYEALKKAQELIETLTIEIINAKSKEKVIALRKKLNYYINKIKNEAKKRNIDCSKYIDSVTLIRKNISKFIRLSKKMDEIEELEKINSDFDTLDEEARKKLQQKLRQARKYNTRIISEKDISESKDTESEEKVESENKNPEREEVEEEKVIQEPQEEPTIPPRSPLTFTLTAPRIGEEITREEYSSDSEYMSSRVNEFMKRYGILTPHAYGQGFFKNLISYIRNIPIYSANKRAIGKMIFDFNNFYRGDDLGVYIAYMIRNSSYIEGLRSIMGKSSLYNKENLYLDSHERCIRWILDRIRTNNINLVYSKAK